MSWKNLIRGIIGAPKRRFDKPTRPKPITTVFEPATPEPKYICENCGMLIETGHKHTRIECQSYQDNPINPDLRVHRTILPGRNDPKIRLPYYYDCSTSRVKTPSEILSEKDAEDEANRILSLRRTKTGGEL